MSNPIIKFVVSTPCNSNSQPSGYRVIQLKDKKLSSLPINYNKTYKNHNNKNKNIQNNKTHCYNNNNSNINTKNNNNNVTDIGVTTKAFCYLKPYAGGIIPDSQNLSIMDYSDYMLISKSNGLIEIVQDYQYKVNCNLPLSPDYVLACIPDGFTPDSKHTGVTIGLEFKEGLLYCCQSNGNIYIFILNLPTNYIQSNNLFDLNNIISQEYSTTSTDYTISIKNHIIRNNNNNNSNRSNNSRTYNIPKHINRSIISYGANETARLKTYIEDSEDIQARQITDFFKETQYTGRTRLKHICYYLTPFQFDFNPTPKKHTLLHYMKVYKDQYVYRPSICISLNQGISHFHINPFDRLSFLIGSQFDPIMIRKVILPMTYLNYLITYLNLKKRGQKKYQMEIIPWEKIAMENGFNSFALWIAYESVYGFETVSQTLWDDIRNDGGTGYLKSTVVWKQGSTHLIDTRNDTKNYNADHNNTLDHPYVSSDFLYHFSRSPIVPNDIRNRRGRRGRETSHTLVRGNTILRNSSRSRPQCLEPSSKLRSNSFFKNLQTDKALADFSVVDTNCFKNNFKTSLIFQNKSHLSSNKNDNYEFISPNLSNVHTTSYTESLNRKLNPISNSTTSDTLDVPSTYSNYNYNYNLSNLGTSFLTAKYKTMEILKVDKSLVLSLFKPKCQDDEIAKTDLFFSRKCLNNISIGSTKKDAELITDNKKKINQEKNVEKLTFDKASQNLSSFKKMFRLTKSLCLIVDTSGLLLVNLENFEGGVRNINNIQDLHYLSSIKNISNDSAVRLSIFDIGLINDAIVVMESFDLEPSHHIIRLNIITTCLPGDIKAFEVEFDSNNLIGSTVLYDCLRLTDVNRFTDKMALLDCNIGTKFRNKRAFSDDFSLNCEYFKTNFDRNSVVQSKRFKPNRRHSQP